MIIKANSQVEIDHPRDGKITGKARFSFNTEVEGFAHIWLDDHNELVVDIPMCKFKLKEA